MLNYEPTIRVFVQLCVKMFVYALLLLEKQMLRKMYCSDKKMAAEFGFRSLRILEFTRKRHVPLMIMILTFLAREMLKNTKGINENQFINETGK